MKKSTKLAVILSGFLTVIAASANAGTVIPAEGASITIDRNGKHIAVTSKTEVKNGDVVTAHKGQAEVTYTNCKQTVTQKHFVKVIEGKACAAIKPVGQVARIDSAKAGLACTNCKAGLARQASRNLLLAGGLGLAVVAAIVASDNSKSSPD
ncbi:MAG: hypothetical protein V3U84_00960 [Thiotrichaceae bacterium]